MAWRKLFFHFHEQKTTNKVFSFKYFSVKKIYKLFQLFAKTKPHAEWIINERKIVNRSLPIFLLTCKIMCPCPVTKVL